MIKTVPVKYFFREGIYIENRDPENRLEHKTTWAIVRNGECLNDDLEWEYEPSPSNRDEEFFIRCRFTLENAEHLLEKLMEK